MCKSQYKMQKHTKTKNVASKKKRKKRTRTYKTAKSLNVRVSKLLEFQYDVQNNKYQNQKRDTNANDRKHKKNGK